MNNITGLRAHGPADPPSSIYDDEGAVARKLQDVAGIPDWLAELLAEGACNGYTPRLVERIEAAVVAVIERKAP